MGIVKDLHNFICAFGEDLKHNEHLFEITTLGSVTTLTCAYEYDTHKDVFDMLLKQNVVREMVKHDLMKAIKIKYNDYKKGYAFNEMTVVRVNNMMHINFKLNVMKGVM